MKRGIVLIAAAVLWVTAVAGVANAATLPTPPFTTNTSCQQCHDVAANGPTTSKTDFSVSGIDYSRCNVCHWTSMTTALPSLDSVFTHLHGSLVGSQGGCRGSACHGSGASNGNLPYWQSPYGSYFKAPTSLSLTPAQIHAIHSQDGWMTKSPALGDNGDPFCKGCHTKASCTSCHAPSATHTSHAQTQASTVTSYAPAAVTVGLGFSPTDTAMNVNVATQSLTCAASACHGTTAAVPLCTNCHADKTQIHGYDTGLHSASVASNPDPGGATCGDCHKMDLYTEHQRNGASSAAAGCANCHPDPRSSFTTWNRTCQQGGCHPASTANAPHANQDASHTPAPAAAVCTGCHSGNLATIHSAATTTVAGVTRSGCLVCHNNTSLPASNDCTVCHFTFDKHYSVPLHTTSWSLANCNSAGCHTQTDLLGIHQEHGAGFGCNDCHTSSDSNVVNAIATGKTNCDACHPGVSQTSGHRATHWANPQLVDPSTLAPNYAYYTGSAPSGVKTSDCAGCHTSNLMDEHVGLKDASGAWIRTPRTDASGNALTCATCHSSVDPNVTNAIATGQTKCDACHVVHGPIPAIHTSTYMDNPPVNCASCHSSNIEVVHNFGYSTTMPSGRVLTGCDVCHANTEGTRGAQVQAAISAGNTKCTACHSATHPDLGSHSATSTASLTNCGQCHGTGSPTSIDIKQVHANASLGACNVCHSNSGRVPDITKKTAECASCHSTAGTDYHRTMTVSHTSSQTACAGSGCHAIGDLAALHSSATTTVAGVTYSGCNVCHQSPTVQPTTSDCKASGCHGTTNPHPAHLATASTGCIAAGCHSSADAMIVHQNSALGACAVCHNNPTKGDVTAGKTTFECAQSGCHNTKLPVDPNHYVSAPHTAVDGTESGLSCSACHKLDMKGEHFKATSGPVSCVQCHSTKVATLSGAWDKTCAACHTARHASETAMHASTTSACAGSGCHAITDVTALHSNATTTVAGVTYTGCKVCHRNNTTIPASTTCTDCHAGHGDLTVKHTASNSPSCSQCHVVGDIRPIHANRVEGACNVCHANPDPNRIGDISTKTAECTSCHPSTISSHTDYGASHASTRTACSGTGGCHAIGDLAALHSTATTTVAGVTHTGCAVCHQSPTVQPTSSDCYACHGSGFTHVSHIAANSAACQSAGCHVSADVTVLHANRTEGKCAVCHANPTKGDLTAGKTTFDCAQSGCHDTKLPLDPNHYPVPNHTAAPFTAASQGGTTTVAAGGQECSKCHSAITDDAHSHTSTSGGSVTCTECHGDTTLGSTAVVAAKWPTKQCIACHGTTTHTTYSTVHVVAAGTCAGTGSSCHSDTDLAALHSHARAGGAPKYNSCYNSDPTDPTSCHNVKDTRPSPFKASSCGAGSGGCHQDKTTANHGGTHQLNTASSNYSNTTVSGCTNSGAGCHGTEARPSYPASGFASYENPYHPNSGCTSGVCHSSPSKPTHHNPLACQDCHDGTFTGAPNVVNLTSATGHYNETSHTPAAASLTGTVSSGGTASAKCSDCHPNTPATGLKQLYAQHQNLPDGLATTTCADCHNFNAGVTAVITARWPSKTCNACHTASVMPANVQHGTTAPVVLATSADGCGASGAGCHTTYDVHQLHKNASGGCAIAGCHDFTKQGAKPAGKSCGTGGSCHGSSQPHVAHVAANSASCLGSGCHAPNDLMVLHQNSSLGKCAVCHNNPTGGDLTAGKTAFDCTQSGCHAGTTPGHKAEHEASSTPVPTGGSFGTAGCRGCHFSSLIDEHITSGLKVGPSNTTTMTCDSCHASTNAAVQAAIAAGNVSCDACHPGVDGNDYHSDQNNIEFLSGNASGHRVSSSLQPMRSSFVVNGKTYSWTLPTTSTFLKSPWTTSSVVTCDNCHTFKSTASGPHGASVAVNMDPNYTADWNKASLGSASSGWGGGWSGNGSDGGGTGTTGLICNKCHNNNYGAMNVAHGGYDDGSRSHSGNCASCHHSNFLCTDCHTGVPHGWRMPRLLAYTSDPAPYNSNKLTGITLSGHSPGAWSVNDCSTSCSQHPRSVSTQWPSTAVVTYGTITGYVKNGSGVAISGASVSTDKGQAATTGSNGSYTLTNVPTGTSQVTVAASGYASQTQAGSVNINKTTTLNFVLALPGNIAGVVKDSSSAANLSGVTVAVSGGGSATTGATGAYTLSGLAAGTYSVTFSLTGYTSQTVSVVVTAGGTTTQNVALVLVPTNLALNKTATASGQYSSSYSASKAFDGSTSTYWRPSSTGSQWLQVDLGATKSMSRFVLDWNGTYYAKSYNIQTSTDGTTWTTQYTTTAGAGDSTVTLASPVAARYVRLNCTTPNSSSYQVAEFQVWSN